MTACGHYSGFGLELFSGVTVCVCAFIIYVRVKAVCKAIKQRKKFIMEILE